MPIDPQQQFRERYDKYVASQQELRGKAGTPAPTPGSKISKKVIIFLGVVAIAFGGGALYALNVNNSGPQVATDNSAKTVTTSQVTDAEIDAELQKIWGPYYSQVQNDSKYRNAAKEQVKLQHAANKLGVNQSSVSSEGDSQVSLQDAVTAKVVNSKTVDIASIYRITGPNYAAVQKKITDSLEQIRQRVLQGQTIQSAYDKLKNTPGFYTPITIQNNVNVTQDSGWAPVFATAIFSLNVGQVTNVVNSGSGAYMVAQVVGENKTNYNSLQSFLKTQQ